ADICAPAPGSVWGIFDFCAKLLLMRTRTTRTMRTRARTSRLHSFPRLLFAEWRRLKLPTNETAIVAVSGGADSTALLLALDELNRAQRTSLKICVAHLDHGIRPDSKADAQWVGKLARNLALRSVVGRANAIDEARAVSENLEQTARHLRYEFLERTAKRL